MMTAFLPPAMVLAAARLGTATLHEAGQRAGALPSRIRPVSPGGAGAGSALAGPALPVLCPPGDNLPLHHAILAAQPGDVLVVDTGGGLDFGYWGEVLTVAAQQREIAGLVIDGGVRDVTMLRAVGFPVFAANVCIRGTGKNPALPGGVGVPLLLGGITVMPGDLVVADADGTVILPAADAPRIVERAAARASEESGYLTRLRGGETTVDIYRLPVPPARTRERG